MIVFLQVVGYKGYGLSAAGRILTWSKEILYRCSPISYMIRNSHIRKKKFENAGPTNQPSRRRVPHPTPSYNVFLCYTSAIELRHCREKGWSKRVRSHGDGCSLIEGIGDGREGPRGAIR